MSYVSVSSLPAQGPERKVKINSEGKYPALNRDFALESYPPSLLPPWPYANLGGLCVLFVCGGDSLG